MSLALPSWLVLLGGIGGSVLLPVLVLASVPENIVPSVNWGEWPMVAILLLVIFVLLWRFEKVIGRKDDAQDKQREVFASVMQTTTSDHKAAMTSVSDAMRDLSEGMRLDHREIIGRLAVHDATVAALTQALYVKGDLAPEKIEAILERIRRERI